MSNSLNVNDTSISVMVYAKAETTNVVFNECSLAAGITVPVTKQDCLAFYQQYGDSYISGLTLGGEYTAVFVFYCQTKEDQKTLSLSLSANAAFTTNKGIPYANAGVSFEASGDLSTGLTHTISTSNMRCSITQTLLGSTAAVPTFNGNIGDFVQGIIDFAQSFTVSTVNQPVVIGYETQGYETLFGPTVSPGFHAIAQNRDTYLDNVGPNLISLQNIQNSYQWIQNAYSTYGYSGDSALNSNYTQLTTDINGLTNWLNTGGWQTPMFLCDSASGGIAQVEFNGQLVAAFIGEYQQITLCTSTDNGQTWSLPIGLDGVTSNYPPALAVYNNQLCLAYTGLNNNLNASTAGASLNFSAPVQFGTNTAMSGPTLTVAGTTLYLAYTGCDKNLYLASSTNGTSFANEIAVGASYASPTNATNPALAVAGNKLYLAFSATSTTAGVGNCLAYGSATIGSTGIGSFGSVTYVNSSGAVAGYLNLVSMSFNLYGNVDLPPILYASWLNNGEIYLWNQATNNCSSVASGGLPSLVASDNTLLLAYLPSTQAGIPAQINLQSMDIPVLTDSLINGSGGIAIAQFNGVQVMAFIGAYTQIAVCTSSDGGQTWGNATLLHGEMSNCPPSLAVYNGQLYLAWTDPDNNLHICSSNDGQNFSKPTQIAGVTSEAGPSLAVAGGLLYLAYTATGKSISLYSSSNGTAFASAVSLPSAYVSSSANLSPALVLAGGSLYVGFASASSSSNGLAYGSSVVSSSGLGSFSAPTSVSSGTITGCLSLANLFGNLYAAWLNGTQIVTWNGAYDFTSDAFTGGLPALSTGNGELLLAYVNSTGSTPAINLSNIAVSYPFNIPANPSGGISQVMFADQLVMAYIGKYQEITLSTSTDGGQNWGAPVALKGMTSNYPPALAVYNNQLCLAFTGLDSYLYTSSSTDGESFFFPPLVFNEANSTTPNSSYAGPSLVVANSVLYLAFIGTDRQINVAPSSDGIDFSNQILTHIYSTATGINPSMAVLNGNLYVAYSANASSAGGNCLGLISANLGVSPLAFDTPAYVNTGAINGYLSLASFAGNLYAAWQSANGMVGWNSITNTCTAPLTGELPSLALVNDQLLLAYDPSAADELVQSVNFTTLAKPSLANTTPNFDFASIPALSTTVNGYAQAVFNNQLVVAFLGSNGQIYLTSSSNGGQDWSGPTALSGIASDYTPALAVYDNQLVLAFTANGSGGLVNKGLYTCYSSTGTTFSTPAQFGSGAILVGPALAVADGLLYLGFVGTDYQLNLTSLSTGISFGAQQMLKVYVTPGISPSLAATATTLYYGFAANSSAYTSTAASSTASTNSLGLLSAPIEASGVGNFGSTPTFVNASITGAISLAGLGNSLYASWQSGSEILLWNQFFNTTTALATGAQAALSTVDGAIGLAYANGSNPPPTLSFNALSSEGGWGAAATLVAVSAQGSKGGYALAEFNGSLYMAFIGTGNQIYLSASANNGQTWGTPSAVASAYSNYPPALVAYNNQLVLAFTSNGSGGLTNNYFYSSYSSTGASFSTPAAFGSNRSYVGPALAVAGGTLYLGFVGENYQLNVASSSTGTSFGNQQLLNIYTTSGVSPGLAATATTLYFGFAANSSTYTASSSTATCNSLGLLSAPIGTSGIGSFGTTPSFVTTSAINGNVSLAGIGNTLYAVWNTGSNIVTWNTQFNAIATVTAGNQPSLAMVNSGLLLAYSSTSASGTVSTNLLAMAQTLTMGGGTEYVPGIIPAAAASQFAIVEFNAQTIVAYAGANQQLYASVSANNGATWSNPTALSGLSSDYPPALAVFNNQVYLAYTGPNSNLTISTSSTGTTFSAAIPITGNASNAGPSLAVAGGVLYLFYTGQNRHIYQVSSTNGTTYSAAAPLPSTYVSTSSSINVATTVSGSTLYLAFSANSGSIGIGSASIGASGLGSFGSPGYLAGSATSGLSLAAWSDNLYVACQNGGNLQVFNIDPYLVPSNIVSILSSSQPTLAVANNQVLLAYAAPQPVPALAALAPATWSQPWTVPSSDLWNLTGYNIAKTTCSALIVFNGQPYMAFTDANNTITVCSSTNGGMTWGSPTPLTGYTSDYPPALAVFNNQLYMVYTATNNNLYACASSDGVTFGTPTQIVANTSNVGPALVVAVGVMYLFYTGQNKNIYYVTSTSGTSYGSPTQMPSAYVSASSNTNMAAAVSGNTLYVAFAASSSTLGYGNASIGANGSLGSFSTTPTTVANCTISGYLSLVELAGSLYAGWNSSGKLMVWNQSTNTVNAIQTSSSYVNSATNSQPTLSAWGGDLVLTYVSTDSYGSSLNLLPLPVVWNPAWNVPNEQVWSVSGYYVNASTGYALAEFNGQWYMAFNGTSNGTLGQIYIASLSTGGTPYPVPKVYSNYPPALAAFNGQLVLAFTSNGSGSLGNNDLGSCYSNTGTSFSTPAQFGSNSSYVGPTLAVAGGKLYLGFVGEDYQLNLASSSTGTSFGSQQTLGVYAPKGVNASLAATATTLYYGFAANSSSYTSSSSTAVCNSLGLLSAAIESSGIGSFGSKPALTSLSGSNPISGNLSLAAAGDNELFIVWANGSNIVQTYQDITTGYQSSFNIATGSMPTVAMLGDVFTLVYTANNTPNLLLSQGQSWSAPWSLPSYPVWDNDSFNIGSKSGFAVAELGSQLILAFTDASNNLHVCSSYNGGATWGNPIALGLSSSYPPALAAFNGLLYLAYTGTGGSLFVCTSSNGSSFGTPTQFASNTSDAGPSLATGGGLLFIGFTGINAQINVASLNSGTSFGNQVITSYYSTANSINPGLAVAYGNLYVGYSGNSSTAGGNCLAIINAPISSSGLGSFTSPSFYNTGAIGGCLGLVANPYGLNAAWQNSGNIDSWSCPWGQTTGTTTQVGTGGQPALAPWAGCEVALVYYSIDWASTAGSTTAMGASLQVSYGSIVSNPTQSLDLPLSLNPPVSLLNGTPVFNYQTPSQPIWGGNGGVAFQDINVGTANTATGTVTSTSTALTASASGSASASASASSSFGSANASANAEAEGSASSSTALSNTVTTSGLPIAISNLPVITSLTLWGGSWMNQIQVNVNSLAGPAQFTHGAAGGSESSVFSLATGEFISNINGISGSYVNQLTIDLNTAPAQSITWPGKPKNAGSFQWATPSGAVVVGFQGRSGSYLNQLQPIVVELEPARWDAPSIQPSPYNTVLPVGEIGVGYDTFTGSALPNSALASTSTVGSQVGQTMSYVKVCESVESLSQTMSKSWGFKVGIGKFSMGYKQSKTQSLNVTDTSVTVVVVTQVETGGSIYTECALNSALNDMPPSAFLTEYGDSFVSSTVNGGEYVAIFVYECQTVSEQQSVSRSLSAGVQKNNFTVGASLGNAMSSTQSSTNITCTCHQSLTGSTNAMPVLTYNPQTDINALVNYAIAFDAPDVNAPAVLSYTTTGYETLLPTSSSLASSIQAVVTNRDTYLNSVAPTLDQLYSIWSQVETLQTFYNTYGYTGDPNISYPLQPTGKGGQLAAAINGLNQWTSNVVTNPLRVLPLATALNPPACLANGTPALTYLTPTNALWGSDPTTPFQDIDVGVAITPTNAAFTTSASGPAAIALTSLPVVSSISLWGGSWVNQIALTYNQQQNGPTTLTHGQVGGSADYALNLQPDEYITMIRGTYGDYINQLNFSTNLGQTYSYPPSPKSAPSSFCWQAAPGEVLVGFQGSSSSYLNQLQPISIRLQPAVWAAAPVTNPVSATAVPVTGLGLGYNSFTGSAMPNSAAVPPVASAIGSQTVASQNFVQICNSLQSLGKTNKGLNFAIQMGPESVAHKKSSSMKVTNTSVTVVVYANAVTSSPIYTSTNPPTLATAAANVFPAELFAAYGDSYVSSAVLGAEYVALFVYDCETVDQQNSVMNGFSAVGIVPVDPPVTIGVDFSKSMSTANSSTNVNMRIYQWLNGSTSALPTLGASSTNEDITNIVNFASNFGAANVAGNGAVLSFCTTGYETLLPTTAKTAFQPVVNNRTAFSNNVSTSLASLGSIRKQMQSIAEIYQKFGYSGDSTFVQHCQQLNEDTQALQTWIAQVNANPTGTYSYPNPPQSVNNGMPAMNYTLDTGPVWGSNVSGEWYDLATSASANTTNLNNNASNPASPIPLTEQPVLASITLWGQNGVYVNQIGTSYETSSGTVQFVHGGTSQQGGKKANSVCASSPLNLKSGEFITGISGVDGDYVNQLTFTTSLGQSLTWPTSCQSSGAFNWSVPQGATLVGFQGSCGSVLNQLQPAYVQFAAASWSAIA